LGQALGPVLEQIGEMTIKIKQYDRQIRATHSDRVSGDPGTAQGLWCRSHHGSDLRAEVGK